MGRTPALEVRPRVCLPATPLARWAGFAVPSLSRQTLRLRAAPPEPASRLQSAHAAVVSALAPVPPGTRAVAKPGQVRRDGPEITLNEDLEPGFGLHPPGSLARPDQVLAGPERPLSLGDLERLADLGFKELRVRRVPRVGWAGRGGPSAGALLGHTGVSWVRERSFEWTQDLPELEPLDARIWVGVTPPPDARVRRWGDPDPDPSVEGLQLGQILGPFERTLPHPGYPGVAEQGTRARSTSSGPADAGNAPDAQLFEAQVRESLQVPERKGALGAGEHLVGTRQTAGRVQSKAGLQVFVQRDLGPISPYLPRFGDRPGAWRHRRQGGNDRRVGGLQAGSRLWRRCTEAQGLPRQRRDREAGPSGQRGGRQANARPDLEGGGSPQSALQGDRFRLQLRYRLAQCAASPVEIQLFERLAQGNSPRASIASDTRWMPKARVAVRMSVLNLSLKFTHS